MSGERCPKCDRVDCDRKAAAKAILTGEGGSGRLLDRLAKAQDDCVKHRVNWPRRAKAAEERAASAEALLREVASEVRVLGGAVKMPTAMVDRITAWLAGPGKENAK